MAISFPSSPVAEQTYNYIDRTWIYTADGAWKRYTNFGQVVSIFVVSVVVHDVLAFPAISNNWGQIDYV